MRRVPLVCDRRTPGAPCELGRMPLDPLNQVVLLAVVLLDVQGCAVEANFAVDEVILWRLPLGLVSVVERVQSGAHNISPPLMFGPDGKALVRDVLDVLSQSLFLSGKVVEEAVFGGLLEPFTFITVKCTRFLMV